MEAYQSRDGFRSINGFFSTVEPVYNGHPRVLIKELTAYTGSLKILTRRGLMSILMEYHFMQETIGQSDQYFKKNFVV